jgi:Ras-related protein Rab-6A
VGIDFFAQIVNKNKQAYKLQFWDTAGQSRFRSIIPSYVRNSHIGIIVFDLQSNNKNIYRSVFL